MDVLKLLRFLIYIAATLPFFCSIILWVKADKDKSQKLLAVALSIVCLFFVRAIFWNGSAFPLTGIVLGIRSTLSGAFLAMFFTLYPIEFILPGWLNLKHTIGYLLPFLLCVLIYTTAQIAGQEFRTLTALSDLSRYGNEFNVWIRWLFFVVALGYNLLIFLIPYRVHRIMRLKKWMLYYSFGSLGMTAIYAVTVLTGSLWSAITYMLYLLLFAPFITWQIVWGKSRTKLFRSRTKEKPLFQE